ncbi:ArsR/SmtB family transcription factor [Yersinia kristensenii]|uniref:ArsR/SmtB family transcription factor n=1 Tax=Yersinia kristensenii TaxID=28152 RepID=UPI00119E05B4|nr:metalloregulator ArsR/SmtB family transcription factor [Yersinia kristensenii]
MSTEILPSTLQIFAEMADLGRVLSNTHRLILLDHIAQGERSVENLAELAGLSIANTSQHLQHLKRAGFVLGRRDGKHVFYRLGNGPILPVLDALQHYAAHNHSEIRELVADAFRRREHLEAITQDELLGRMQEGSIILLDVRPEDEYRQGHLPGAIHIPVEELESRLVELSPNQEVVAYCRGAYCMLSEKAVALLRAEGRQARRWVDGFPEWKAAGHEIETGLPKK